LIRVTQIQQGMQEAKLDALVLRLAENILVATGWFVISPGLSLVIVPPTGDAFLVLPESEADEAADVWAGELRPYPIARDDFEPIDVAISRTLRSVAREIHAKGGSVGFEGSFESIGPPSFFGEPNAVAQPTQELIRSSFGVEGLIDFTEALEEIRSVKTASEIDLIRRTNEIAVMGLNAFKQAAVPGASEIEVMASVEQAIAVEGHGYKGARWVRSFATVASGPQLVDGWKFFRATTRIINQDDLVMIELGTVADGYWSDHTRTVVAGTASTLAGEAYAAARSAFETALETARPGATGDEVDAAARKACADQGFVQFPHHTGHGTGFRYHESRPALTHGSTHLLLEGQVLAVEPGIYGEELNGGVRHEDDALVTPNGAIPLATTNYGLDFE
jgi:Xaa-Pro dipeptidase